MTEIDHRPIAIPLFLLGAALVVVGGIGLVADATSELETNNPGGALAAGALLLFGAFAVAALLNPGSDAGRPRGISSVAAFALVLLLLAAFGGAAPASVVPSPSTGVGAAAATQGPAGLVAQEELEGSVGGVATPLGPVGGQTTATHELGVPATAGALRVELTWAPGGPGGATTLALRIETAEGQILAEAQGASGVTLDVRAIPSSDLVLVVSVPDGAATTEQGYVAQVEYYDSAASLPSG